MARKRKKSRAKKTKRFETEAPKATSESAALEPDAEPPDPSSSEDEEPVIDLDADLDDEDEGLTALLAEAMALGEDVAVDGDVAEPIDHEVDTPDEGVDEIVVEDLDAVLDDEDDDAEGRERLIAEALAFVERQETGETGEPSAEAGHAAGDAEADGRTSGEQDKASSGAIASPATRAAPAAPPMSQAAIAALEAIQRGLIAGDLDEEVLDLGEVSDPSERERLLASAMAHAEMQEARYRVRTETSTSARWKGTFASLIFVVSLLLLAQPPAFIVPDPPATLTTEDDLYGVRVTLLLQAQQIEGFRARQERLPNSLAEVDARLPGVRFVRSSSRLYQLTAHTAEGEVVVYDSGTPDPAFASVRREWVTTRDRS